MILKPTIKAKQNNVPEEKPKKKKGENKLPSNEYKPLFEPVRLLVKETPSQKDPTKVVKQYVEVSVKRFGDEDDIVNPVCVWISMYQESEFYTGYLKGKSVYFPLEALYEVLDGLNKIDEECDKRGIE